MTKHSPRHKPEDLFLSNRHSQAHTHTHTDTPILGFSTSKLKTKKALNNVFRVESMSLVPIIIIIFVVHLAFIALKYM